MILLLSIGLILGSGSVALPPAQAAQAAEPGSVAVDFVWSGINGTGGRTSAALISRPVRAWFGFHKWWWTTEGRTAPVVARLQKKVGIDGRWTNTAQTVSTSHYVFDFTIRPYSLDPSAQNVTVYYRLKVPTGGVIREGDNSPSIKIKYQNRYRYTGFKRTLYRDMKQYCPDMAIRVMPTLPLNFAGVTPRGLYEIQVLSRVRHYSVAYRKAVILHECGHHLQWKNYGSSAAGWARMSRQAASIFGTNHPKPVEHMADCVSHAAEPDGYLGYGGRCTTKQIRYAKRVLAGGTLY